MFSYIHKTFEVSRWTSIQNKIKTFFVNVRQTGLIFQILVIIIKSTSAGDVIWFDYKLSARVIVMISRFCLIAVFNWNRFRLKYKKKTWELEDFITVIFQKNKKFWCKTLIFLNFKYSSYDFYVNRHKKFSGKITFKRVSYLIVNFDPVFV